MSDLREHHKIATKFVVIKVKSRNIRIAEEECLSRIILKLGRVLQFFQVCQRISLT